MVEYYSYWEQEIYNALTQLIITAMQVCQSVKSLRARSSSTAVVVSVLLYPGLYAAQNLMRLLAVKVPGQKGPVSKKPLFKIQAIVRCSQAARPFVFPDFLWVFFSFGSTSRFSFQPARRDVLAGAERNPQVRRQDGWEPRRIAEAVCALVRTPNAVSTDFTKSEGVGSASGGTVSTAGTGTRASKPKPSSPTAARRRSRLSSRSTRTRNRTNKFSR